MAKIDFESEMQKYRDSDEAQEQLDNAFGEGNDVISIIGVAHLAGQDIAFARMITPDEILPLGPTIEVKRDLDNNILFLSNNLLLMAAGWDERLEVFAEAGAKTGLFMFEVISPTKLTRALVRLDGTVVGTIVRDITKEEYEKHLGGFFNSPLDSRGSEIRMTANLEKPIEC